MKVAVEELDNGLRAAFVSMPHFRTTSARLLIHSGSLHEDQTTAGTAHFLEHVTFQGTESLPSEQDVHEFSETNGLTHNAFTGQTETRYVVDGYDVQSVGRLIMELAFRPALKPESLERERNPIVDELRGYASAPAFHANIAHMRAIRGERYARPIGGDIEDVLKITPESLSSYHTRNYHLGNAVLVLCSGEPVPRQRETIEQILSELPDSAPPEPSGLALSEFNPSGRQSSLQLVDLPLAAQTTLAIDYGLPPVDNEPERFRHNILGTALSKVAHRRLRGELALCYHAQAGAQRLYNLHFGAESNWGNMWLSANANGTDSTRVLDAMRHDVYERPVSEPVVAAIRLSLSRSLDHTLQGNPSETADFVGSILSSSHRQELDFEESLAISRKLTADSLQTLQKEITDQAPLVLATSPDPTVLEKVGEWATGLSQR